MTEEVEETTAVDLVDQAALAAVNEEAKEGEAAHPEAADQVEQDLVDLDGLDKFKFQGRELSPEELNKQILMQSDYTKKTQAIAKEQKYVDNLYDDLENVRRSPNLANRFMEIYPEKYHRFLGQVLNTDPKNRGESHATQKDPADLPGPLLEKLKLMEDKLAEYDHRFHEEKVGAQQARLDSVFTPLLGKYELADEDAVINTAQRLLEMNSDNPDYVITDKAWERLFRQDHESREKRYSERQKKLLESQVAKGNRGADTGPGGLAMGRERKKVALEDVADQIIQDLGGR